MTLALTPADLDLRDFAYMPVDIVRLFGSEFHAQATDPEWRAGVTLWLKSYHQVPAASLPDDDVALARLAEFGRDVRGWKKVRDGALHGWVKCDDGRLYHPVVAEKALEGWLEKLAQRKSSAAGNAKRWGSSVDTTDIDAAIATARTMLAALNPQSRSLSKRPPRPVGGTPVGTPAGNADSSPEPVPSGSQEKGSKGKRKKLASSEDEAAREFDAPFAAPPNDAAQAPPTTAPPSAAVALRVEISKAFEDLAGRMAPDTSRAEVWLAQGHDPQICLAVVREGLSKKKDISNLSYFDRRVAEAHEGKASVASAPPRPTKFVDLPPDEQTRIARHHAHTYATDHRYWTGEWGPRPGQPGCLVPRNVLEEHGIDPDTGDIVRRIRSGAARPQREARAHG